MNIPMCKYMDLHMVKSLKLMHGVMTHLESLELETGGVSWEQILIAFSKKKTCRILFLDGRNG